MEWLPGGPINAAMRLVSPACGLSVYQTLVKDGNIYVDLERAVVGQVAMFATTGEVEAAAATDGKQWFFVTTEESLKSQPNQRAQGVVEGVDLAIFMEGTRIYACQVPTFPSLYSQQHLLFYLVISFQIRHFPAW